MTAAVIHRPVPATPYRGRGACLGKLDPACTATHHGTASAYKNGGCRCPHARDAFRIYEKRRREGRSIPLLVAAVGTHRKIQALWALGHNSATIGEAAGGMSQHHVQRLVFARGVVTYHTWHLVDRAFRALSTVPGTSTHTRNRARRAGYMPPLAWDNIDDPNEQARLDAPEEDGYDETTVDLACDGRLTHAQLAQHRPDLIETIRRLARRMPDQQIADHLHWPGASTPITPGQPRTRGQAAVLQIRTREGIPAPARIRSVYPRVRDRARQHSQAA